MASSLKGKEGYGKDLQPLDRGAGIFGFGVYDVQLDEESGGQKGNCLNGEGEDEGGTAERVQDAGEMDKEDVAC